MGLNLLPNLPLITCSLLSRGIMVLSVAFTFDPNLIPGLSVFPEVREVFGKLGSDLLGGGRSTYMVADANREMLQKAVEQAHSHNIEFNYLLNAANLDGFEQTRDGQKKIRRFLDDLSELNVDSVTVSVPYLLKIVKSSYPHFKTRVGVFARISTPRAAQWWEEMGADILCISAISCNRRFDLLKSIRSSVKCDLQLIVNACCLQECPFELAHMNMLTHASREGSRMHSFNLDYCFLHCSSYRLRDKSFFLKSIWIRPEDLSLYEKSGYHHFKIVDRACFPEMLIKRVKAYAERSFDGNLMELIAPVARIKSYKTILPFFRPDKIKPGTVIRILKFIDSALIDRFDEDSPVYIDNKKLDGYIRKIFKKGCDSSQCRTCSLCEEYSKNAVTIKPEYKKEIISQIESLEKGLNDGSIF